VQKWEHDALKAITEKSLSDLPMDAPIRLTVVQSCIKLHSIVQEVAGDFQQTTGCVPPPIDSERYLELVKTFRQLLDKHRSEISKKQRRYMGALEKLNEVTEATSQIREELLLLRPELQTSGEQADQLQHEIDEHVSLVANIIDGINQQERHNSQTQEIVDKLKDELSGVVDKVC
jgi:small-conductance mechanosensitive channel